MAEHNALQESRQAILNGHSVVSVFNAHSEAEYAVKNLQKAGFDMAKFSIVAKDYLDFEHVVGYYNTGDRMGYWSKLGAFWGGFWGLLLGSAFLIIPGIGPVVIVGPLVSLVITTLEGAVIAGGLSAIGAAFYSIGIPRDSILKYENSLKANKFLIIAHGTTGEIGQAREILHDAKALETNVHRGHQ